MKFNVGDLIIIKDYLHNNKCIPAYIIEVHPVEIEEGWRHESITYKYPNGSTWRLPFSKIEAMLEEPKKRDRWYHHPVKE